MSSKLLSDFNRLVSLSATLGEGIEKDLINFITNQEQCRRKWEKCETELRKIKEDENSLYEQHRSITVQLDLARNQLDHALRKRPVYEKRIRYLEQQLHAIASLLNDSEAGKPERFDRHAILQMANVGSQDFMDFPENKPALGRKSEIPSDLDDSAEETVETQLVRHASNKRSFKRKLEANQTFGKKLSTETSQSFEPYHEKTTILNPSQYRPLNVIVTDENTDQELPRVLLSSDDQLCTVSASAPYREVHSAFTGKSNPHDPKFYPDIQSTVSETLGQKPVETITSKPHNLIQKKEIKPGKCSICQKGIGFQKTFLRCQDCNIKCHEDCKKFISQTCIVDSDKMILSEMIQNNLPYPYKVPRFVYQIIIEIERRGLSEQGLYRVSGSIKDIKELKKKIKSKNEIDFTKIQDIHTLTHILKLFLRELSEPLITRQLHASFMECGEKNDLPRVYKLIDTLPIPNRHTLAFVFLHLRKVARVQENLMDFKALARVLGPTIVGHACLNPTGPRMYEDTRIQPMLMELFLGISDEYWHVVLGLDESCMLQGTVLSPTMESEKSKYESSLMTNSPLLGRIDRGNIKKRNREPQYPITRGQIDHWSKRKLFDSPIPPHS